MGSPPNSVTDNPLDHQHEVLVVKRELSKIGIFLEGFGINITRVYSKPRPYGFDFDCAQAVKLQELLKGKSQLNEDTKDTVEGRISSGVTNGVGYREIGTGPRLHIEIDIDGKTNPCNVHINSHGYVVGKGQYDWNRGLEHGYWDLGGYYAPFLYGSFGDQGQVGPAIRPVVGPDGRTHWLFGIAGHW